MQCRPFRRRCGKQHPVGFACWHAGCVAVGTELRSRLLFVKYQHVFQSVLRRLDDGSLGRSLSRDQINQKRKNVVLLCDLEKLSFVEYYEDVRTEKCKPFTAKNVA